VLVLRTRILRERIGVVLQITLQSREPFLEIGCIEPIAIGVCHHLGARLPCLAPIEPTTVAIEHLEPRAVLTGHLHFFDAVALREHLRITAARVVTRVLSGDQRLLARRARVLATTAIVGDGPSILVVTIDGESLSLGVFGLVE
jgi:hypothetical protein